MEDQELMLQMQAEEEAALEEERRIERLQSLGSMLSVRVKEYIGHRQAVENRMVEDLRQYHGRYDAETEARMNDPNYKRSRVFANITRSKTNAAEARIADMLFPADDRNWGIQPTPIPELQELASQAAEQATQAKLAPPQPAAPAPAQDPNQPQQAMPQAAPPPPPSPDLQLAIRAQQLVEEAKKRADRMQTEIDDQLTESQYVIESRRMIHQAAVLGTGIIKAPVIVNRSRKAWREIADPVTGESAQVLESVRENKPGVEWVDVWNFFPDMAARTIEEAEAIFERKFVSKRQLRELAKRPGWMPEAVRSVLERDPREFATSTDHLDKLRQIAGVTGVMNDSRYEMWEYHGPVEAEDLRACGCEVEEDVMKDREAVVIFIGDTVLFADLNPMETGDRPYRVWQWEPDDSCMFGYGVPYLMRTPQRILNTGWRMLMDNSGVAVGPQVVVKQGKVIPSDGTWDISPMKIWFATDETAPVGDVFSSYDINSHQAELTNIINAARQFADEETNLPMIAQGEGAQVTDQTAAGMSMLMNAANTVLRRMVKSYDDNVTKPVITGFYDWNMQFNPVEAIKGDFTIDARGSTALMVKELQTQQLMQFVQFYAHPAFAPVLMEKAPKLLRKIAESMRISPAEVIPSDEELEKMKAAAAGQPPQVAPQVEAAKIRAEAAVAQSQASAQADMAEIETRKEMAAQQHAAEMAKLQITREIEMLKLANTKQISLDKIKAQLADTAIKTRTQKQLFAAERQLKVTQGEGI